MDDLTAPTSAHTVVVTARTVYDVACPCGYRWDAVDNAEGAEVLAESHREYVREVGVYPPLDRP